MDKPPPLLNELSQFLSVSLGTDQYPADERGGIYRSSARPVRRLGLTLEPWPGLARWVDTNQIDALWLHRPWQLDLATLPTIGILHNHLPFDEHLTVGFNNRLAAALGALETPEPLGFKPANEPVDTPQPPRPIGMLFGCEEQEFDGCLHRIRQQFGGYDRAEAGRQTTIGRLAVVGAMTDALVREASQRGASVYVTGQYRKPAQQAVNETGIAVIAVGHRRSEEWGLQTLAGLFRKQWPSMEVLVHV